MWFEHDFTGIEKRRRGKNDVTYVINDDDRRNRISGNFMNWTLLAARNTDERGAPGVPVFRTQVTKRGWLIADVVGLYPKATLQR
jgi:hypothetical protein